MVRLFPLVSIILFTILFPIVAVSANPTTSQAPLGTDIICWIERYTDHRAGTPTYLLREVYPHSREPSPYSGYLYSEHSFRYKFDGKLDYRSLVIYVDDKLSSETRWWLIGLGENPSIGSSVAIPTFDDKGKLIILQENDTTAWPDDRGGVLSWTFYDYSSTRQYEHKFNGEGYSQGAVIADLDAEKRISRRMAFDNLGKLQEDVKYTYNEKGWIATETRSNEKLTMLYVIDSHMNWTRCDAVVMNPDGKGYYSVVWSLERKIVYDDLPVPEK